MDETGESTPAIKAGDVVYLASNPSVGGGQAMTVGKIRCDGDANVYWFKGTELAAATVPTAALLRQ